jgi:hypothetical protein
MRYWELQHFTAQEFLPQAIFAKYGIAGLEAMDARILWTLDQLRNTFNVPITVNNWDAGGEFDQRGYRTDPALLAQTPLSQHRFGRACDFQIASTTPDQFRKMVADGGLKNELAFITHIENATPDWIHIDCRMSPSQDIIFFNT